MSSPSCQIKPSFKSDIVESTIHRHTNSSARSGTATPLESNFTNSEKIRLSTSRSTGLFESSKDLSPFEHFQSRLLCKLPLQPVRLSTFSKSTAFFRGSGAYQPQYQFKRIRSCQRYFFIVLIYMQKAATLHQGEPPRIYGFRTSIKNEA